MFRSSLFISNECGKLTISSITNFQGKGYVQAGLHGYRAGRQATLHPYRAGNATYTVITAP